MMILAIIFMGTHICTKDTAIYVQAVYCEDCERWLSNYHQWTKHLTRYKHRKNTDPNFVQSMRQPMRQSMRRRLHWQSELAVISEQDEEASKVHGQTEKGNKSREHAFGRNKKRIKKHIITNKKSWQQRSPSQIRLGRMWQKQKIKIKKIRNK